MRPDWPGWPAAGTAFGLGAVLASGQQPIGAWWLALPALTALLMLLVRAPTARAAAWIGLFAGTGHFVLALSWLVQPFLIDPETYGWMAPFAVVLMSGGLALFWAAAAALSAQVSGTRRLLALVAALTLAEYARGHVLTGFPWASIGHVWIASPVAQSASLFGPTGLTLVTLLAAGLPVASGWRGVAASVVLIGGLAGFGQWRLSLPDGPDPGVTVRLVQPNAEQTQKWDPDKALMYFRRLLVFTAASPRPDLVVWPETAVPYLMDRNPEVVPMIADAAQGATVVFGVQRADDRRFYNSLVVLGPTGTITATYDKHHLVPFGEYIPTGDLAYRLFGLSAFAAREGNGYSPGPGPALVDLGPGLGRVLPLICYEAVFPQDILRAPGRPDWLLQITNDAWFGTLSGPYQHLAQARLRAIEQGLPMVRVANTGVSAVIDANGRVREEIPLGRAAYLDVSLPASLAPTLYSRTGEWPVLVFLAGLAAALVLWPARRSG